MGAEINGRPVVVTGGGSGIGAALAQEAAGRGASFVAVVDVDVPKAEAVAAGLRERGTAAGAYAADVSDAAAVEALAAALVDAHGLPGLVCANAGVIAPSVPLLDTTPADAAWVIGVNYLGVLHTLQSFGRRLVASEAGGWLMATGSEHSLGVPHLLGGPYTAAKHAVLGMCDVLRGELPAHVGVSVLCPGLTASGLWNATSRRPAQFGGPIDADGFGEALLNQGGMDAATVATRAFDGAEAGHFVIPTHYNARAYAERRATDVADAFDRLQAVDTRDFDVNRIVDRFVAQMGGGEPS